jgi:hypothetical protein
MAVCACSGSPGHRDHHRREADRAAGAENSEAAVVAEFVAAAINGDHDDASGQLTWYADSAYGPVRLAAVRLLCHVAFMVTG